MHRRLLGVLADPTTREPLELVGDRGEEWIESGELASPSGARFPIVAGIPRFVGDGYADSFGLQWNRFPKVQLDSANGASYSRIRFEQELKWGRDELAGQWVVDAGCGAGRFAEIAAEYGAEVIAVDLSASVEATARNLRGSPNVHVIQADITRLPLRSDRIGFLYSIGVLQHTPDPMETARRLVEFLRPGARFGFTIYGRRPWTLLHSKYLLRPLTRRMDPDRLMRIIEKVMPVVFPVTSVLFSTPGVGRVANFVLPVANYPWQKDLPREFRYDQTVLDTFDMLSPRYDHPVTHQEVERALAGVAEDVVFYTKIPVTVQGVRNEAHAEMGQPALP